MRLASVESKQAVSGRTRFEGSDKWRVQGPTVVLIRWRGRVVFVLLWYRAPIPIARGLPLPGSMSASREASRPQAWIFSQNPIEHSHEAWDKAAAGSNEGN